MDKKDVKIGMLVKNIHTDTWGYVTCMDDGETGVYIKNNFPAGIRLFLMLKDIEPHN